MAVIVSCQTCFSRWRDDAPLDPAFGACSHIMKTERKGENPMQGPPFKKPAPPVLLSQGATRPGTKHGQYWGQSPWSVAGQIRTAIGLLDQASAHIERARRPTPRSHADPRLSNPVPR